MHACLFVRTLARSLSLSLALSRNRMTHSLTHDDVWLLLKSTVENFMCIAYNLIQYNLVFYLSGLVQGAVQRGHCLLTTLCIALKYDNL